MWLFFNLLAISTRAQLDPQFTQFYANPLYLAPSFAGATLQHRIATSVRDQWTNIHIPGTYLTYSISYDHYFANYNSGLGVNFVRDDAGSANYTYTLVGLSYSYDFSINDYWNCRPGLSMSYFFTGINNSKLIFLDHLQYNTTIDPAFYNDNRATDIDFNSSVLFYSEKIWVGVGVNHLRKPNPNFIGKDDRLSFIYYSFGGLTLYRKFRLLRPIDETITLAYSFKKQKSNNQLDLGLYWRKNPVVFGLWYRGLPFLNSHRGDAIALLAGFKIDERFSFGYSYDFTISNLVKIGNTGGTSQVDKRYSGGAHEISLIYEFKTKKRIKIHQIPCPDM